MNQNLLIQGRSTTASDINLVRHLIAENPDWNRTKLSQELCRRWNWCNAKGRYKDMACRSFLLKLEKKGLIVLPEANNSSGVRKHRNGSVDHSITPINANLRELQPITMRIPQSEEMKLFNYLLDRYHYLGYNAPVGQNMKYLAFDASERVLACILFGSAAWKCLPRDSFICWTPEARAKNINFTTNNGRFLILPWVRVPHLASHLLSLVSRRISSDWEEKYGHPLYLLETFVEKTRFNGTCYKAANWVCVGQTKGRSRNDRYSNLQVAIKDAYLLPLKKNFREVLCLE